VRLPARAPANSDRCGIASTVASHPASGHARGQRLRALEAEARVGPDECEEAEIRRDEHAPEGVLDRADVSAGRTGAGSSSPSPRSRARRAGRTLSRRRRARACRRVHRSGSSAPRHAPATRAGRSTKGQATHTIGRNARSRRSSSCSCSRMRASRCCSPPAERPPPYRSANAMRE